MPDGSSCLYWSAQLDVAPFQVLLGQAKLIHSLSSGIFQKAMRAGGHFSYFIVQLIALSEQSDCSIRVFWSEYL